MLTQFYIFYIYNDIYIEKAFDCFHNRALHLQFVSQTIDIFLQTALPNSFGRGNFTHPYKFNLHIYNNSFILCFISCVIKVATAAAAAAKLLQSCPTLCDPIDGSPPGFPIPGILQARTLEWVAISFSNA